MCLIIENSLKMLKLFEYKTLIVFVKYIKNFLSGKHLLKEWMQVGDSY